MGKVAFILVTLLLVMFYVTFNVSTITTIVGGLSLVLYVGLEAMRSVSTDSDFSWKDDKTMSAIYAASFAIFSMAVTIFSINSIGGL
jgi:hypothetical protein